MRVDRSFQVVVAAPRPPAGALLRRLQQMLPADTELRHLAMPLSDMSEAEVPDLLILPPGHGNRSLDEQALTELREVFPDVPRAVLASKVAEATAWEALDSAIQTARSRHLDNQPEPPKRAQSTSRVHVDADTGLPNAMVLEESLQDAIERGEEQGGRVSAVLVDCSSVLKDDGTPIPLANAELLCAVGNAVRPCLRGSSTLGRVGRQELVVLLPDTRLAEAQQVVLRVQRALSEVGIKFKTETIRCHLKLAVLAVPPEARNLELLMAMLRKVTSEGGARHSLIANRNVMEELTRLSTEDSMVAVAQPILDLKTWQVHGYELLSRGPVGPLHMPADFFRLALEQKMVTPLDMACLRKCIQACRGLGSPYQFHVNIFPSTLMDTPVDELLALFPADRVPGEYCLEISEQQVVGDVASLVERVSTLSSQGIHIAMDDVGFGKSSLEILLTLEPDVVKIDRCYVHGLADSTAMQRRLHRLLRLVRELDAVAVAEGIDRDADFELLTHLGVEFGQGFLFGMPTDCAA